MSIEPMKIIPEMLIKNWNEWDTEPLPFYITEVMYFNHPSYSK